MEEKEDAVEQLMDAQGGGVDADGDDDEEEDEEDDDDAELEEEELGDCEEEDCDGAVIELKLEFGEDFEDFECVEDDEEDRVERMDWEDWGKALLSERVFVLWL